MLATVLVHLPLNVQQLAYYSSELCFCYEGRLLAEQDDMLSNKRELYITMRLRSDSINSKTEPTHSK